MNAFTVNGHAITYEVEHHLAYFTQYGVIIRLLPEQFTYGNVLKILHRLSVLNGRVDHD